MLSNLRTTISNLILNLDTSGVEVVVYQDTLTFKLSEPNISSIDRVLINNTSTSSYTWSSSNNEVTMTGSVSANSIIQIEYTYTNYSTTELNAYIKSAIVNMNVYLGTEYAMGSSYISPTPNKNTLDIIALIASILIKPDYTSYKLPNVTVTYNSKLTKDQRIEKLLTQFNYSCGINGVLDFTKYGRDRYDL